MRETLRQAFHVAYGFGLAVLLLVLGNQLAAGVISGLLVVGFAFQRFGKANRHLIQLLEIFGREKEREVPGEGAILFTLGCGLAVIFFPKWVALAAILVLTLADSASTLVGRWHGGHRFAGGKSLEGALAFLVVAGLTLVGLDISFWLAVGVAAVATVVEAFVPFDDNVTVPLIVGILLL